MMSETRSPSIVLGIDSAMNGCGAAIYFPARTERNVSVSVPMARGQAESLVPLVKDVVARAGIKFSDINMIVTTRGPGTFTGLRVGLSAARSFALALDVPLAAVSTLEVLARGYIEGQNGHGGDAIAVIIESKRSDYYFQIFDADCGALIEACALDGNEILKVLTSYTGVIIGDAQMRFKESCGKAPPIGFRFEGIGGDQPSPLVLARIGFESMGTDKYNEIDPLYLRGAEVSHPKSSPSQLEE